LIKKIFKLYQLLTDYFGLNPDYALEMRKR